MTDIEKHANGNGGGMSSAASHTLTNVHGATGQGAVAPNFPVGADGGGGYPVTLGATDVQQHFYQGGLPLRTLGNPAPLGLFSFASTTFILSLINVKARGVNDPNIVVGMALGVGGLVQILAGMWEFAAGNTFGATAFSSYGGFWLSWAAIYIPDTGIIAAYDSEEELDHAVGFYLASWFIFTFLLLIGSLRSNAGLISLFFFLTMTFMLLMIGHFIINEDIIKAGGALGLVTAAIAYYCACANLYSRESSFISLPLVPVPGPKRTA